MFPFMMTDKGVTVFINGKPRSFTTDHPNFRELRDAIDAGDESRVTELVDVRTTIANRTMGRVTIHDNVVTVNGREVEGLLVDRIMGMISRGSQAVDSYIRFLDRAACNPREGAIDETYGFIEYCNLPITPDGFFLAYKKVRENYTDVHSGTFDNSVGATPSMPRSEVDDDRNRTCSAGLHFCSEGYLSHFGGSRIMVVKVDPADVVSIPVDYNNAKGRACRYEVVGEMDDHEDRLTPWYSDEYELDPEAFDDEQFDGDFEDDIFPLDIDDRYEPDADLDVDPLIKIVDDKQDAPAKRGQKLDSEDVLAIVDMLDDSDMTYTDIAKVFDVHRETIARIDRGDIWNGLTGRRDS